jgi:hypothetical protein
MTEALKDCLWKNSGAAIDMLRNAIAMWPDNRWDTDKRFFCNAYHCAVFLDYYLTVPPIHFSSSLPYTLKEQNEIPPEAIDDVVPDRIYSKQELLTYVEVCREKCRMLIEGLSEETLMKPWLSRSPDENLDLASMYSRKCSVLEILFYNIRHVQHHAAQLNLLLRQTINKAPDYVSMAPDELYIQQ